VRTLLLALVLGVALAAPAQAQILDPADAAELAQDLADAQEEQVVCYGWEVGGSVADFGSSADGPGATVQARQCAQWVILQADVTYTCDACEGEDFATVRIDSTFPDGPRTADLEALGFKASDLVSDNDDRALFNMVAALPLVTADRGLAPPVPAETPAAAVPATDRATGTPGSDLLRDRWFVLVLCGFLIAAGPAYLLYKRAQLQTLNAED
jgi:hypothetical protein